MSLDKFFFGIDWDAIRATHKNGIEEEFRTEFEKATTVFPDIRLDPALLKAFGRQSLEILRRHYEKTQKELALPIDTWIKALVPIIGGVLPIPAATGLGALVIGMVIDTIVAMQRREANDESSEMVFERVFAREKASKVRDIMEEYVKRHTMHIKDLQKIKEELSRLEKELSLTLTQLKNSMKEGVMNSQALKIWINGACFHVQMWIHLARLGDGDSTPVRALVRIYKRDWEELLTEYSSFKLQSVKLTDKTDTYGGNFEIKQIYTVIDDESQKTFEEIDDFHERVVIDAVKIYVDKLMASPQIEEVRCHFKELEEHLNELIEQEGSFHFSLSPPP